MSGRIPRLVTAAPVRLGNLASMAAELAEPLAGNLRAEWQELVAWCREDGDEEPTFEEFLQETQDRSDAFSNALRCVWMAMESASKEPSLGNVRRLLFHLDAAQEDTDEVLDADSSGATQTRLRTMAETLSKIIELARRDAVARLLQLDEAPAPPLAKPSPKPMAPKKDYGAN